MSEAATLANGTTAFSAPRTRPLLEALRVHHAVHRVNGRIAGVAEAAEQVPLEGARPACVCVCVCGIVWRVPCLSASQAGQAGKRHAGDRQKAGQLDHRSLLEELYRYI